MSGIGKFNGNKLKDARTYRGISILELANEISVSKQAISQFENNKSVPSLKNLLEISKVLRFPSNYFFEVDEKKIEVGNTYFRALTSANKKDRVAQINKTRKIASFYNFISEYLELPQLNLIERENLSIEELALKLREKWGIGLAPINNIVNLMERNGIIVSSFNTDSNKIDAFSQLNYTDNNYYFCVVLGEEKISATRRQFSAAHELGHILLHDWKNENTEELSKDEFRKKEEEANQFAAEFLLPKESFLKDLLYEKNLEFYVKLKKKWKVSISAMVMRAYQLKKLNINQYQYLMRQITQKGWRTKEPLDDIIKVEQPTLFNKAIQIILSNNVMDKEEFMESLSQNGLGFEREEIEELLNLEKDILKIEANSEITDFIKIKKSKNKRIM